MEPTFSFLGKGMASPLGEFDPVLQPIPTGCIDLVEQALVQLLNIRSDVTSNEILHAIDGALPEDLNEYAHVCTLRVLAGIRHAITDEFGFGANPTETAFTMDGELRWYLRPSFLRACLTSPLILRQSPSGGIVVAIEPGVLERTASAYERGKPVQGGYVMH